MPEIERGSGLATEAPRRTGRCRVPPQPYRLLHVVGALAVIVEIEAFALLVYGRPQADRVVDDLVDDQRTDAGPRQGHEHALALGPDLRGEVVVADLADRVVHDAGTAECRRHQNAG